MRLLTNLDDVAAILRANIFDFSDVANGAAVRQFFRIWDVFDSHRIF